MIFDGSPRRGRSVEVQLPPGQHLVPDLPLVSTHVPAVMQDDWELTVVVDGAVERRWDWAAFRALPSERISVDLHCVSGWSVLSMSWQATPVHSLLAGVATSAEHVVVRSYAGYSANLPLEDLLEMPTWLAFARDGKDLSPEQGGPARLLVPHLYLWKSVKWVRGFELTADDRPGTRERAGFHNYGDPWRQQRSRSD
jgi:DMSO/TMAO reductase YedYZ molybdopterin-dependent catalytic subunit